MTVSIDRALRAATHPCIAFTGAGGKTTAMFQLARVLSQPVIVTATSHLGAWQVGQADRHIMIGTPGPLEELEHGLQGVLLVTGPVDGDPILKGCSVAGPVYWLGLRDQWEWGGDAVQPSASRYHDAPVEPGETPACTWQPLAPWRSALPLS